MLDISTISLADVIHWSALAAHYGFYRWVCAFLYLVFAAGLFHLASQHHSAVRFGKTPPGQFPPGYFTLMTVQLFPLLVTGFVLHDELIIGTRGLTLGVVLVCYALVHTKDGTFNSAWHRWWLLGWLSVVMFGVLAWHDPATHMRGFFREHEKLISWAAVAGMFLFMFVGQRLTARTLYEHFMAGNYSVKRFSLQLVRFFIFLTQSLEYWHHPSNADPLRLKAVVLGHTVDLSFDPVFLASFLGLLGVTFVVIWSVLGLISGTEARREKKSVDRQLRRQRVFAS